MTIKLIHHTPESASGGISPFDEAILHVCAEQEVWIVCPYLNTSYLQRIITYSTSWKLITDIEEWLAICDHKNRTNLQAFLLQNQHNIHHIRDLHAKVIVSDTTALVGSANFTDKGITSRVEMSVLFEQEPQVSALREWFDTLWQQSASVAPDELQQYIVAIQPLSSLQDKKEQRLTSHGPSIRSKLKPVTSHKKPQIPAFHDDMVFQNLVKRIRSTATRAWINAYFNLMEILINETGLSNDDPRLVISLPKSKYFLPVSVNNRYVLAPHLDTRNLLVGIIYGPEFEFSPEVQAQTTYNPRALYDWRFSPLFRSENPNETPFFIRFSDIHSVLESKEIQKHWISAISLEMKRATSSPYRKHHQPVVYEAAVNLDYRNMLLENAFSAPSTH